jgi:hypothetical protein
LNESAAPAAFSFKRVEGSRPTMAHMDERPSCAMRPAGPAGASGYARSGVQPQAAAREAGRVALHAQPCPAASQLQAGPQLQAALQSQLDPQVHVAAQAQPLPQAQLRAVAKRALVESVIESSLNEVRSLHCRRCRNGKVKRRPRPAVTLHPAHRRPRWAIR